MDCLKHHLAGDVKKFSCLLVEEFHRLKKKQNKKTKKGGLTLNCSREETVTSATSQPAEEGPDVRQSASPNTSLPITCTVRVFEGPWGSQYLQTWKETVNIPQVRSKQRSCLWRTHQKRAQCTVAALYRGVRSCTSCALLVVR